MTQVEKVMDALKTIRCPAACSEETLHEQTARALEKAGIEAKHEAVIGPRCRIDFLAGNIGIEIKKSKPAPAALIRQLTRYAACEEIAEIIVIAPHAVRVPKSIGQKRVTMIGLERLWGIFLP